MRFRNWLFRPLLDDLEVCLTLVLGRIRLLHNEVHTMTQALDNIAAAVSGLEGSLTAAMALLDDIKAKLDAAIAGGNSDPAIQALADKLTADKAALDAKVAADTPAA